MNKQQKIVYKQKISIKRDLEIKLGINKEEKLNCRLNLGIYEDLILNSGLNGIIRRKNRLYGNTVVKLRAGIQCIKE